jgi:serine/threonine protein kinase
MDLRASAPASMLMAMSNDEDASPPAAPATPSKHIQFHPSVSPHPPDGELVRGTSGNSTGSGTSAESPPPSDTMAMRLRQITVSAKLETSLLEEEMARMSERQRMVDSHVHPDDLAPRDIDLRAGFSDWRDCPISGAHLNEGGQSAQGAAGQVLRALWKSSIPVAIKENVNDNSSWDDELTTEMQLFLDLHHPHVVACYGILKEEQKDADGSVARTRTAAATGGTPGITRAAPAVKNSIVTEACRTSLEHYLKSHSNWEDLGPDLVDRRKYTVLLHVSLGLQKLHDMGVLHRDIKAGNILLDGAAGVCSKCERQGTWKICDFGEAKVLQSPEIHFMPAEPLPAGSAKGLVAAGRFQKITSPQLLGCGARWYCWLLPEEGLPVEFGEDEWVPCPHGGFVYLFNNDPKVSDERDCFFDVRADTSGIARTESAFPESLGPFSLLETEFLPRLNMKNLTYKLRDKKHRNPELQKLKSLLPKGQKVGGKISPPSKLTLPREARRKLLIPQEATHFVWAYQGVDLEQLTQEESHNLDTESAEINFARLGGYVYIKVPDDELTGQPDYVNAECVSANAIAMSGTTCRTGTIDRGPDDDAVTAKIASPEMLEGKGIGLETDIYGFGIVMWETLTRQEAWHWIGGGKDKELAIMNQVLLEGRRPKAPAGLSWQCTDWMRRCLHTQPEQRPKAAELTEWLDDMRRRLDVAVEVQKKVKIKESGIQHKVDKGWWITDRKHEVDKVYWSPGGRYSLHPSIRQITPTATTFTLQVNEITLDQWMETAFVDDRTPVEDLDTLPATAKEEFGLKFKIKNKRGEWEDHWPRVARVDKKGKDGKQTIASQFPEIQEGCKLTHINDAPVPKTFKEAVPMLKKLPLRLEFSAAAGRTDYCVPAWLRAGLEEIGLVKLHESRPRQAFHRQYHQEVHARCLCDDDHALGHLEHAERALGYEHEMHSDGCPKKKEAANKLVKTFSVGQAKLVRSLSRELDGDGDEALRKRIAELENEVKQLKFQNEQLRAKNVQKATGS